MRPGHFRYDELMPHRGKSLRFARNVGFNVLGQVGTAAASFFAIPFLLHRLGGQTYALYILMHAVAGYLALLSFGAGTATVKYVAQFNAAQDARGLRAVLRYSAAMHLFGALAAAVFLLVGVRFCAVRLFHVPEPLLPAAILVLRCAAGAAIFTGLFQFACAVLQGLQRFDWNSLLAFSQNGLMPVGAAAAVALGLGLSGVAGWYVALSVGGGLLALSLARSALPAWRRGDGGEGLGLKAYGGYSLGLWLGALASMVSFQSDKIFLARGVSLAGLTLYAVPAGLLQRLAVLPAIIAAVLMPMLSEVQGPDASEALRRMYLKSVRFLLWAVLPAYALLFALMPQFLGLWLGGDFPALSVWPARLLVLSQAVYALNFIPNSVAAGRDRPWLLAGAAWAQALLSVLAWILLIPRYHLLGVALGSLIAQVLPTCVYLAVLHRRVLGLAPARYLDEGLRAPLVSAACLLAVVFPLHAWASGWGRLILLAAGGAAVYCASAWLSLTAEDRDLLRRFLRWEPRAGQAEKTNVL